MPTKSQKQAKDKLPSLEHRYHYRFKRRSTPEGIALEALGGDRDLIAKLADVGACIMRDYWTQHDDGHASYAWWLASILSEIASGEEPNKAFGWPQGKKKGQWKLHNGESWDYVRKAYEVGRAVEIFATAVTGMSYEDAIAHGAEAWRVDPEQCRTATAATRMGLKKSTLVKAAAKDLALDMVAAFGASGHAPMPRETADGYHKELINTRGNEEKPFPVGSD